ncbi:MAG TPA: hypothetical protein DCS28_02590 [Candidatus Moranbacteria bacterium]|nr:hypothetical protein [Candidatus Moranbacteria bacterium]HAT74903.1 hypothetical protein [Candidatus Moranbacteria bacterium]
MFSLIKLVIWLCGLAVVGYFILGYFGYEVNKDYFNASKAECQKKLDECKSQIIHNGIDGAKCDFNCTDPKLIIKPYESTK